MHTHSPNGSRKKRPPEMSNRFTPDDDVSALCHAQLERSQQVSDGIKTAFGFLAATLGSAGSKASPIDSVAPGACPSCAPREVCIRVAPASAQKAFRPSSQFDLGLGSTE